MSRRATLLTFVALAGVPVAGCGRDSAGAAAGAARATVGRDTALARDLELANDGTSGDTATAVGAVDTSTRGAAGRPTRQAAASAPPRWRMRPTGIPELVPPSDAAPGPSEPPAPATPAPTVRPTSSATSSATPAGAAPSSIGTAPDVPATARAVSTRAEPTNASSDVCGSPVAADQQRCLTGLLARSDVTLDRNYQALIAELKREAGTQPGQHEPASVESLRVEQRAWIVTRDTECRQQTRSHEGPLWAPVRARCLADFSARRAAELAAMLKQRTGR